MTNETEFARARDIIPGGVNSPVRAYRSVGGTPRFLVSARGAYVTDVEGREYIDLVGSWGPALLGHAHPAVVEAVQDAATRGLSFGATTPGEAELAELLRDRTTVGGTRLLESVRLVSTGTEATMTAVRLARGATGRDLVVKFAGHYHGHSDGLLAESGSGVATLGLPGSAGVPADVAALTIVLPYNDLGGRRGDLRGASGPDRGDHHRGRRGQRGCARARAGLQRARSRTSLIARGRSSSSTRCSPGSASAPPDGGAGRPPTRTATRGCPTW